MKTEPHLIPRIVIKSIAGGLLLMAFFTMMWIGVAQGGLLGNDHHIVLVVFGAISLVFVTYSIRLFLLTKHFPEFTTDDDAVEGRKISKSFGIIFGIEGTAIPLASITLKLTGLDQFILPSIALIVGLHFYPMAKIFSRKIDYYLATYTCLAALICIYLLVTNSASQIFVQGFLGIGVALTTVTYGVYMLSSGYNLVNKKAML